MMAASPTSTFVPTNLITIIIIIIILFKPRMPPQPSNLNTYSAMATPPQLAYGNLKPAPVSKIGKCSLKFPKYNKYPVPKKKNNLVNIPQML